MSAGAATAAVRDPVAEAEARLDAGLNIPPTIPSIEWDIMGHPQMPDDSIMGRLAALEDDADAEHAAAKAAAAATKPATDDEEDIYVLLDFNKAELPPGTKLSGEVRVEVCCAHDSWSQPPISLHPG